MTSKIYYVYEYKQVIVNSTLKRYKQARTISNCLSVMSYITLVSAVHSLNK